MRAALVYIYIQRVQESRKNRLRGFRGLGGSETQICSVVNANVVGFGAILAGPNQGGLLSLCPRANGNPADAKSKRKKSNKGNLEWRRHYMPIYQLVAGESSSNRSGRAMLSGGLRGGSRDTVGKTRVADGPDVDSALRKERFQFWVGRMSCRRLTSGTLAATGTGTGTYLEECSRG